MGGGWVHELEERSEAEAGDRFGQAADRHAAVVGDAIGQSQDTGGKGWVEGDQPGDKVQVEIRVPEQQRQGGWVRWRQGGRGRGGQEQGRAERRRARAAAGCGPNRRLRFVAAEQGGVAGVHGAGGSFILTLRLRPVGAQGERWVGAEGRAGAPGYEKAILGRKPAGGEVGGPRCYPMLAVGGGGAPGARMTP